MCGRYANHVEAMGRWEQILGAWPGQLSTGYNLSPSQTVPVFLGGQSRGMRWGLVPAWSKEPSSRFATFNARAETLASKPTFRDAWKHSRRCLIPALGYYEWIKEAGEKQPYFVCSTRAEPLVFGGIWEHWQRGEEALYSCAVITLPARAGLELLHQRMPLMLAPEMAGDWLSNSFMDATELMTMSTVSDVEYYPVSKLVNNGRNQGPDLIRRLPEARE